MAAPAGLCYLLPTGHLLVSRAHWESYLLGAEPKVTGHHSAVLEATGQVVDDVLIVQPVILVQVLLKCLVLCMGRARLLG